MIIISTLPTGWKWVHYQYDPSLTAMVNAFGGDGQDAMGRVRGLC